MTQDEEIAALRVENAPLRAELAATRDTLAQIQARLAEVETRKTPAPAFVRPDKPRTEKESRRTREARHNQGRRREEPTHSVAHALDRCPDCGYLLRGESVDWTRQVIDRPEPTPVVVTEHRFLKRQCPACDRWQTPTPDWTGVVLGQGRCGVRLTSLVADRAQVARLPVRTIQALLHTLYGLRLSVGAIGDLLHRLAAATAGPREAVLAQARASAVAHRDETGWREGGQNGDVWTFCTPGPDAVRYYARDRSRAGAVAARLLTGFRGYLGTDFYSAYNGLVVKHQRCWAHVLRDLHALKERHARDPTVLTWARRVRLRYDYAKRALAAPTPLHPDQRARLAQRLDATAHRLGLRYAGAARKGHRCHALCHRLLRHQGALFAFVHVDGLSPDNNLAERSLRPLVIVRKVSSGTRSDTGTDTRMALATLFGTWQARGLDPFAACLSLLHSSLP